MKTISLINNYLKLLGEQDIEQLDNNQGQFDSNIDENEKYVIKILTNAFIFNPKLFDLQKQKYISTKIDEISRMVNVPISRLIDELKKIIALDRSLKVESKTLNLLNRYMVLAEQPADATEPQSDNESEDLENISKQADKEQSKGEGNNLNLEEIFPLYKELIIKALRHTPTEEELMIIRPIVNEFADTDSEKIVEAIQNMLSQSLEDKEVQDNLSNA
jgi:hypothetical protein